MWPTVCKISPSLRATSIVGWQRHFCDRQMQSVAMHRVQMVDSDWEVHLAVADLGFHEGGVRKILQTTPTSRQKPRPFK